MENRAEVLEQLKLLHDQVHQTAERIRHLPQSIPFHIHPQSLNYDKDLSRFKGEYRRLAQQAQDAGLLSESDLAAEGLPMQFED